ncbi:MAG: transcriptional regulator [Thermoproteota archaeon]
MRPPCEPVVQYVLPAFRSLVARELVMNHRLTQVEVAKKLGTTQAAISQYFLSKRGEKRMKNMQSIPKIRPAAKKLAKEIASGHASADDAIVHFCRLCMLLREKGLACKFHKGKMVDDCKLCKQIYRYRPRNRKRVQNEKK